MGIEFVPPAYKGIVQDARGWWAVIYSGKTKVVRGPFPSEEMALLASVEPRRGERNIVRQQGSLAASKTVADPRPPE